MKQFRSDNRKGGASAAKRLALALILIVACALMTACYMEPDRVVDAGNSLDNSGKQDFQTVITDTPAPTNTPTPAPTSSSGQQRTGQRGLLAMITPPIRPPAAPMRRA